MYFALTRHGWFAIGYMTAALECNTRRITTCKLLLIPIVFQKIGRKDERLFLFGPISGMVQ